MNKRNILIEFSASVAEIINGGEHERSDKGYFCWETWKIESAIINLLSGRSYCGLPGKRKYAEYLVGWHMSDHNDIDYSAEQYFRCVFEHEITNRRGMTEAPTDKLQTVIRANCLNTNKQQEANLSPVSLWRILQRAGEHSAEPPHQLCYRYWVGEDNRRLKIRLYDVLSSANRHYAEIYRLGIYPPNQIEHINVSQARKLNRILSTAKQRAVEAGEADKWRKYFATAWAENPLSKIGDDKITTYADFMNHPIGKRILGLVWANPQMVHYDENTDPDNDPNNPALLAEVAELSDREDPEDDLEAQFYEQLATLTAKLNRAILPVRDKELLLAIIEQRDISDLIDDDEDEDKLFARLKTLLHNIWQQP